LEAILFIFDYPLLPGQIVIGGRSARVQDRQSRQRAFF
jgi:hypothetical protein